MPGTKVEGAKQCTQIIINALSATRRVLRAFDIIIVRHKQLQIAQHEPSPAPQQQLGALQPQAKQKIVLCSSQGASR